MATALSGPFFDNLHDKYLGDKLDNAKTRAEAAWKAELPILRQFLPLIQAQLGERYSINVPLGVGGVSIVLQVIDTNLEVPRALKFARPTPGRESLFSEILSGEISYLRQAVHPNIVEIYQRGTANLANGDLYHFYIMQFINGAKDAKEYFEKTPRNVGRLVSVLTQILAGLEQLHKIHVLHGDIKLENILVAEDGHAVISDLGSARHFTEGTPETTLVFTRAYAHPDLIALAVAGDTDPDRVRTPPYQPHLYKTRLRSLRLGPEPSTFIGDVRRIPCPQARTVRQEVFAIDGM
ncbi:MAG: protein kinase [Roseiarcus sp.]